MTFTAVNAADSGLPHTLAIARCAGYQDLPQLENGAVDTDALGVDFLGGTDNIEPGQEGSIEFDRDKRGDGLVRSSPGERQTDLGRADGRNDRRLGYGVFSPGHGLDGPNGRGGSPPRLERRVRLGISRLMTEDL